MAEVCVFGLGYVGLPTASLLASAGFQVLGVDIDPRVVDALTNGRTNLKEAGLATVVSAAVQSHNLVAGSEPEPSDIFILCVPTPTTADHRVDLAAVEAVTRSIVPHLKKGDMVILESTSPVGTTRGVVDRILRESGLEPGKDFDLCYCPERVLPGNTVRELVTNSRIIGGFTLEAAQRAAAMYERFCQGAMTLTDDRTAELCKLMENTFRDVNIAVANVFGRVAERAGINVWKAIEHANLHPRVNILSPGPGVGGHCIPVDPWFLIEQFPEDTDLLRAARTINDTQGARLLERMRAAAGGGRKRCCRGRSSPSSAPHTRRTSTIRARAPRTSWPAPPARAGWRSRSTTRTSSRASTPDSGSTTTFAHACTTRLRPFS